MCQQPQETFRHVLTCQSSCSTTKHYQLLARLRGFLEDTHTMPSLTDCLVQAVTAFFSQKPIVPTDFPSLFEHAVEEQNILGWDLFLLGRLSPEWRLIQNAFLRRQHAPRTGERWASALITHLFSMAWDLWELRNGALHQQAPAPASHLNDEISTLYQRGPNNLPTTCHYLFHGTLSSLLSQPRSQRLQWVKTVKLAHQRLAATPTLPSLWAGATESS